ncbi:MAG: trypsin-like serine protease [Myxococcota bacterium]|jgi:hypothetical protein|nr:trypsin-like serine protease [Myxococcota bacterium]
MSTRTFLLRTPLLLLFTFVSALACQPEVQDAAPVVLPIPDAAPQGLEGIIGGAPTGGSWDGVVAIQIGNFGYCTGTLIDPEVVLTAGHCVRLIEQGFSYNFVSNPSGLIIRGGADGYLSAILARGSQVIHHPDWTGDIQESQTDIAMIKLNKALAGRTVHKLRDYPSPMKDDPGMLVGYGLSGSNPSSGGTQRAGDTTLLNVYFNLIETGDPANTCSGDSGGPLFTDQGGQWVLTGVTSFGTEKVCMASSDGYSVNPLAYCP